MNNTISHFATNAERYVLMSNAMVFRQCIKAAFAVIHIRTIFTLMNMSGQDKSDFISEYHCWQR